MTRRRDRGVVIGQGDCCVALPSLPLRVILGLDPRIHAAFAVDVDALCGHSGGECYCHFESTAENVAWTLGSSPRVTRGRGGGDPTEGRGVLGQGDCCVALPSLPLRVILGLDPRIHAAFAVDAGALCRRSGGECYCHSESTAESAAWTLGSSPRVTRRRGGGDPREGRGCCYRARGLLCGADFPPTPRRLLAPAPASPVLSDTPSHPGFRNSRLCSNRPSSMLMRSRVWSQLLDWTASISASTTNSVTIDESQADGASI